MIFVSDSAANITAGARNVLAAQAALSFETDTQFADDENIFMDLSLIYVHGGTPGDIAVITYMEEVAYVN